MARLSKAKSILGGASIDANLETDGSTFEGRINLDSAAIGGSAFLRYGATFKAGVDLIGASVTSDLDFSNVSITGPVDMTGCRVNGELRLGSSRHLPARWEQGSSLGASQHACWCPARLVGRYIQQFLAKGP